MQNTVDTDISIPEMDIMYVRMYIVSGSNLETFNNVIYVLCS